LGRTDDVKKIGTIISFKRRFQRKRLAKKTDRQLKGCLENTISERDGQMR
jgi:hypothetical protein